MSRLPVKDFDRTVRSVYNLYFFLPISFGKEEHNGKVGQWMQASDDNMNTDMSLEDMRAYRNKLLEGNIAVRVYSRYIVEETVLCTDEVLDATEQRNARYR